MTSRKEPTVVNGMKVSAILPLGTTDYVMALIFEHGGIELDVTPVIGAVFNNGAHHDPSTPLALPGPELLSANGRHAPVQDFIREFFSSRVEARYAEISDAAMAKKMSSGGAVGYALKALVEEGFLKKIGTGLYSRKIKRPPKKTSKLPLLLDVLAGMENAHTAEIMSVFEKRGTPMRSDAFHSCLNRAHKDGLIERVALGTYRISKTGKALLEGQKG